MQSFGLKTRMEFTQPKVRTNGSSFNQAHPPIQFNAGPGFGVSKFLRSINFSSG